MDVRHSNLKHLVKDFLSVRDQTLLYLEQLKLDMQEYCIRMKKLTIAGSSLSLFGTGAAIVSLFLAPVTFGGIASLSLLLAERHMQRQAAE